MTKVGLGKSEKYKIGSVHENGTGMFEITDRFLDSNVPMLEYRWLNGDKEGKIEKNKEANVNASIWKFQKVRGLIPSSKKDVTSTSEIKDDIKILLDNQDEFKSHINVFLDTIETIEKRLVSGDTYFKKLFEIIGAQNTVINSLYSQMSVLSKTLEDRVTVQQETIQKLIDKI